MPTTIRSKITRYPFADTIHSNRIDFASSSDIVYPRSVYRSYFSDDGIKYNIGRVPIGGTDFSTRKYTYADTKGVPDLSNFALATEDMELKVGPYFTSSVCGRIIYNILFIMRSIKICTTSYH